MKFSAPVSEESKTLVTVHTPRDRADWHDCNLDELGENDERVCFGTVTIRSPATMGLSGTQETIVRLYVSYPTAFPSTPIVFAKGEPEARTATRFGFEVRNVCATGFDLHTRFPRNYPKASVSIQIRVALHAFLVFQAE